MGRLALERSNVSLLAEVTYNLVGKRRPEQQSSKVKFPKRVSFMTSEERSLYSQAGRLTIAGARALLDTDLPHRQLALIGNEASGGELGSPPNFEAALQAL